MLRALAFLFVVMIFSMNASVFGQQKSDPPSSGHQHPAHGPHDGELLEVGNHEYHAEVVLDESKKQMMIYLLDKEVKSYVALDSPFLAVNLVIGGKPVQIKLKPIPQDTDAKGYSSCFGVVSPELMDGLHTTKSDPKLALRIRNKSYSIRIRHDHVGHQHAGQTQAGRDQVSASQNNSPKRR
jgi:hypothetical protein